MHTDLSSFIIDDRSHGNLVNNSGTQWRAVSDTVMGGISHGALQATVVDGKPCLRLTGNVSLENNGGFVQASLDLSNEGLLDAHAYQGIEIEVFGNDQDYNLHLRTADTRIVWQSYRAGFHATPSWQNFVIPFDNFSPHRIDQPLNTSRLLRLGVVAIGRQMQVDVCIGRIALYKK